MNCLATRSLLMLLLVLTAAAEFSGVSEAKGRTKSAASRAHSSRSTSAHVRSTRALRRPAVSRTVRPAHITIGRSRPSFAARPTSPRSSARRVPAKKAAAAPKTTRSRGGQSVTTGRTATGRIKRSAVAKRTFEVQSGYPKGRPGYVVDHIRPLACGGADVPSNMQWQTVAAAAAKDKWERAGCR